MPNNHDESGRKDAEIRTRSAEMLNSMILQRIQLLDIQRRMTPRQFGEWASTVLKLDMLTLRDMLSFDGTVEGISDRMIRWFDKLLDSDRSP
jgi:hypothetical protein